MEKIEMPNLYKIAYFIQQKGCPDFILGECDECGLCEVYVPTEMEM